MVESFLGTLMFITSAFALACVCGYGVVALLLPDDLREHRLLVMPTIGYVTLSLLTMMISGTTRLSVSASVWIALALLLVVAVVAIVCGLRPSVAPKGLVVPAPRSMLAGSRVLLLALLPSAIVVLWPTFVQGAEMYLGSVNLDFFQSMVFQDLLRRHNLSVFADFGVPLTGATAELVGRVWPTPFQSRFGGVMFSYLLESITGMSPKSSLTATMGMWVLCLPLSVFVFSRVVMGLTERVALFGTALLGISVSITMGYVYVLVGQTSGMPILPLLITALFVALTRPSWRPIAWCALIVWGLFWVYASMLLFALAPMGLLALYLLIRGRLSIRWALMIAAGIVAGLLIVWGPMPHNVVAFLQGLVQVSGRLIGLAFNSDYLTELFFVYWFGVTSYPLPQSVLFLLIESLSRADVAWTALIALAGVFCVFSAFAYRAWHKSTADNAQRVAVGSMLVTYAAVWVIFTFVRPYGYSLFKMSMWLQFLGVPLLAYGFWHYFQRRPGGRFGALARPATGVLAVVFIATNIVAAVDYGDMSLGKNRKRGYIVITFGLGGNPDVVTLGRDLQPALQPTQTVGLAYPDPLQNHWSAYRLLGRAKQVALSHESLDADDSYLPDPVTGDKGDSAGNVKSVVPISLDEIASDYYLMPGRDNLNPEIIDQALPRPVWESGTFQLQAAKTLNDFLFLGHGFYREQFPSGYRTWWQPPGPARWSREGGEFYLLQPSQPGKPYRLSFTGMVGFGYPSASRTLEFWHRGEKFDEVSLTDVGRVVSAPFYPEPGLDRVVMVIREKVKPLGRAAGLWNVGVNDQRHLNVLMSNVKLLRPDESAATQVDTKPIGGDDILNKAYRFDGLSSQRWIGKAATIAYAVPVDAPQVELEFTIPGNLGYRFPFSIAIVADGVEHRLAADAPGTAKVRIPLPERKANEVATLEIRPPESREIENEFAKLNRPITQSIRLESVTFSPAR